jgi:hypothetical protein
MLGPLGEGAVEDVLASIGGGVGIIPGTAAGAQQQNRKTKEYATHAGEFS